MAQEPAYEENSDAVAVSPDGLRIAYPSDRDGANEVVDFEEIDEHGQQSGGERVPDRGRNIGHIVRFIRKPGEIVPR